MKGVWLNEVEVGEGGMNAAFAGELGVPVIMASGDSTFCRQIHERIGALTVATKEAIGNEVARLYHPEVVRARLTRGVNLALKRLDRASPYIIGKPVRIRMRFARTTRADVLQAIPGMARVDGFTASYTAKDMAEAYKLIRLMYKYISI